MPDDADVSQSIINNRTGSKQRPLKQCPHCGSYMPANATVCYMCNRFEVKIK